MLSIRLIYGDLASIPLRHEGTDHHDPAEDPNEGGLKITACTGHRYANEMVDKPYNRFGITYDVQSRIVSTLILRKQ
jgi:hypothetical protein